MMIFDQISNHQLFDFPFDENQIPLLNEYCLRSNWFKNKTHFTISDLIVSHFEARIYIGYKEKLQKLSIIKNPLSMRDVYSEIWIKQCQKKQQNLINFTVEKINRFSNYCFIENNKSKFEIDQFKFAGLKADEKVLKLILFENSTEEKDDIIQKEIIIETILKRNTKFGSKGFIRKIISVDFEEFYSIIVFFSSMIFEVLDELFFQIYCLTDIVVENDVAKAKKNKRKKKGKKVSLVEVKQDPTHMDIIRHDKTLGKVKDEVKSKTKELEHEEKKQFLVKINEISENRANHKDNNSCKVTSQLVGNNTRDEFNNSKSSSISKIPANCFDKPTQSQIIESNNDEMDKTPITATFEKNKETNNKKNQCDFQNNSKFEEKLCQNIKKLKQKESKNCLAKVENFCQKMFENEKVLFFENETTYLSEIPCQFENKESKRKTKYLKLGISKNDIEANNFEQKKQQNEKIKEKVTDYNFKIDQHHNMHNNLQQQMIKNEENCKIIKTDADFKELKNTEQKGIDNICVKNQQKSSENKNHFCGYLETNLENEVFQQINTHIETQTTKKQDKTENNKTQAISKQSKIKKSSIEIKKELFKMSCNVDEIASSIDTKLKLDALKSSIKDRSEFFKNEPSTKNEVISKQITVINSSESSLKQLEQFKQLLLENQKPKTNITEFKNDDQKSDEKLLKNGFKNNIKKQRKESFSMDAAVDMRPTNQKTNQNKLKNELSESAVNEPNKSQNQQNTTVYENSDKTLTKKQSIKNYQNDKLTIKLDLQKIDNLKTDEICKKSENSKIKQQNCSEKNAENGNQIENKIKNSTGFVDEHRCVSIEQVLNNQIRNRKKENYCQLEKSQKSKKNQQKATTESGFLNDDKNDSFFIKNSEYKNESHDKIKKQPKINGKVSSENKMEHKHVLETDFKQVDSAQVKIGENVKRNEPSYCSIERDNQNLQKKTANNANSKPTKNMIDVNNQSIEIEYRSHCNIRVKQNEQKNTKTLLTFVQSNEINSPTQVDTFLKKQSIKLNITNQQNYQTSSTKIGQSKSITKTYQKPLDQLIDLNSEIKTNQLSIDQSKESQSNIKSLPNSQNEFNHQNKKQSISTLQQQEINQISKSRQKPQKISNKAKQSNLETKSKPNFIDKTQLKNHDISNTSDTNKEKNQKIQIIYKPILARWNDNESPPTDLEKITTKTEIKLKQGFDQVFGINTKEQLDREKQQKIKFGNGNAKNNSNKQQIQDTEDAETKTSSEDKIDYEQKLSKNEKKDNPKISNEDEFWKVKCQNLEIFNAINEKSTILNGNFEKSGSKEKEEELNNHSSAEKNKKQTETLQLTKPKKRNIFKYQNPNKIIEYHPKLNGDGFLNTTNIMFLNKHCENDKQSKFIAQNIQTTLIRLCRNKESMPFESMDKKAMILDCVLRNFVTKIDLDIKESLLYLEKSNKEFLIPRKYVFNRISDLIRRSLNPKIDIIPYGSFKTGLLTPFSDLDFAISNVEIYEKEKANEVLRLIKNNISCYDFVLRTALYEQAVVPVLKFTADPSKSYEDFQNVQCSKEINVDLIVDTADRVNSINTAFRTTEFIIYASKSYASFSENALLLKYLLNCARLSSTYHGLINRRN